MCVRHVCVQILGMVRELPIQWPGPLDRYLRGMGQTNSFPGGNGPSPMHSAQRHLHQELRPSSLWGLGDGSLYC